MSSMRKDSILYELFVYAEWRPDPDFIRGEIAPKKTSGHTTLGFFVNFLKPEQTLVENISSYINQLQPWQICLGDDGKVVAVLQDSVLEIRTKRGNYSTIVARAGVPRDANPQWRKMVWSPDCSMLAIAHSSGNVSFYDLMATNLFDIASDCSQPPETRCTDTTHAIAGIVFLTSRVIDRKWSCEVLLVDYRGVLRSFFVSPTDEYISNHKFTIEGGVSSVTYHTSHNIIFVTGLPSTQGKDSKKASDYGLRGWRLLNDSPFYKLCISLDKEAPLSLTSWISTYHVPSWKKSQQSVIIKAVASPNGSLLACSHVNGSVSIWQLPSLRCFNIWPLQSQPNFDIQSPLLVNVKHKVWPPLNNELSEYTPIDINWWNSEAIILSRLNGSISICSTSDLHNMLGDSPEFLQGHPQISSTFDNGFLSLECEAMLISAKKLRRDSDSNDDSNTKLKEILDSETAGDSSDDEKLPFAKRSTEVIKTALYIVTDMERFQPKPKKLNLLSRVYRLLCLRSTTPEDLYSRKIENADFSEALTLANAYNLDSDLVYQQQWRSSKVSNQSIKDYLGKVSKKIWVIQQCCDRVPETFQAAKELLEFGLEISNMEILKDYTPRDIKKSNKDLLDNITLDELSTQKTDILRYRHTMLFYFDRLDIYKAVIESEYSSYSSDEYDRLRINSISKSAVEFAREGRVRALNCLWPHLSEVPVRLMVLQNLPETLDPMEYKSLLPTCINKPSHLSKINVTVRDIDWCEKEIFSCIWANSWNDDVGVDETGDSLELTLPSPDLTDWYINRARNIESLSGLPKFALTLVTLAQEGNVPGLEALRSLLITLITLLYEVNVEEMTLIRLEGCSRFQVSNYLMSKSTEGSVIDDVKSLLFPYLERCEKLSDNNTLKESLFKEYVVNVGKKNLALPIMILQKAYELKLNTKQCLDLVNGCLLAQDSLRQLPLCFKLLDALPKESDESVVPSYFVRAFDEMERFLHACALLDSHDVSISYAELKTLSTVPKDVLSLLIKMARNASNRTPNLSSDEWNELLADILDLHSKVFCCIDIELCYEIYASSLLSSANKDNIQAARQVLTCNSHSDSSSDSHPILSNKLRPIHKINISQKVPYHRSVSLILEASTEYFNAASSICDVSLEYAWACLQLIKEDNPGIQDEKDLISALKIIEEFELSILPIQVRLYSPKIGLIEDCLNSNNKAHKSVEKLLQLARLLRISDGDEIQRKVMILSLCAEKAADNEDFESARSLCRQLLVTAGGSGAGVRGERAARRLGAEARLSDPSLRRDLLNLALLHCHAQHIENLIQTRSCVESEILQCEMNNLVNLTSNFHIKQVNLQDSIESTDDDYVDALTSPLIENKSIMSASHVMEKYIHKPLLALSDKNSWREALNLNWINEKNEPDSSEEKLQCLEDSKIASHSFYSSLHNDCHISSFSTHYDKCTPPDVPNKQLVLLQALMRNNLLQDSFNYGCPETRINDVLIQCAEHTLGEDTALFISQLLTIRASDHSAYKECFLNIPMDSRSINGILYFYALFNYMEMHNLPDGAFFLPPAKLVSNMIKSIENLAEEYLNDPKKDFLVSRDRYIELLEGEKLNNMGCDLNIGMFINDEVYRKTAVINLARTSKSDSFKKAMDLALKYNIEEQEIVLAHFSYILINYIDLGFPESNAILSEPKSLEILKTNPFKFAIERLDSVWISIHGNDYQGLILYFNLINSINSNHLIHGLSAKDHIKLIKKVKSACSSIDYKFLIRSPQGRELVDNLLPYLSKDNIGLVAKLLRNLPPCLGINFNASCLYRHWLLKHFFDVPENMYSSKKWMQQYRECSGYFSKLKKDDMLLLIKEILFSPDGLQKLPPNTRMQIANQTDEYCKHEHVNDEIKTPISKDEKNWEDIGEEISRWGNFLDVYHSDSIKYVFQNSEKNIETWREIECSRGDIREIMKPLQNLISDSILSTSNLRILIKTLNDDLCIDKVILQALDSEHLDQSNLASITKRVVDLKAENMIINQELLDKLKPYSTSSLLTSKQRLDLMSLYKTESDYEDMKMLIQIALEIISSTWSEDECEDIKEMDLADDGTRPSIFMKLLQKANTWNKLKVLVDLINMWPSTTFIIDQAENPCLHLILKLFEDELKIEDNIPLLKLLLEKNTISENDIQWIISSENTCHIIGKIWLCLLCKYKLIHTTTLPSLLNTEKDILKHEKHIDDNMISLILKKGLFTNIVKTSLYPKCVQFLLRNESIEDSLNNCSYTLNTAVNDLLSKNYLAEAGALKLAALGVPHTLRGFTQALKFMKR